MQLRSKLAAVTSAGMLTVGLAVAFAGPAAAATNPYTNFSLVNVNSGLCLGIHSGTTDDGYAQQQDCNWTGSQEWTISNAAGYQQLQNKSSSDHECLSIQDGSTAVNAQLTGYTCKSASDRPDQYWNNTPIAGTTINGVSYQYCYTFASEAVDTTPYVAGVSGASTAQYADIIDANFNNTTGSARNADVWCMRNDG
jgi:hypothetical protein